MKCFRVSVGKASLGIEVRSRPLNIDPPTGSGSVRSGHTDMMRSRRCIPVCTTTTTSERGTNADTTEKGIDERERVWERERERERGEEERQHERHTATPLPVGDRSKYYVSKTERGRRPDGSSERTVIVVDTRWESFDDCTARAYTNPRNDSTKEERCGEVGWYDTPLLPSYELRCVPVYPGRALPSACALMSTNSGWSYQ